MKLTVCWLVVWSLYVGANGQKDKQNVNPSVYSTLGYGLELLLTKFDIISSKLQRMEDKLQSVENKLQRIENKLQDVEDKQQSMNDYLKSVENKMQNSEKDIKHHRSIIVAALKDHRSNQEQMQKEMFTAIQNLEHQVELNLSDVHNRHQQVHTALRKLDKGIENVHNISRQIMDALPQVHQIPQIITPTEVSVPQPPTTTTSTTTTSTTTTPTTTSTTTTTTKTTPKAKRIEDGSSCKDVSSMFSGTYLIRMKNDSEPFKVYCEQKSFGGGWSVFQYRYDGSLDFYRGWNEYRDGFGDLKKEFWLGLEKVHQITSGRKHELIVELKDCNGTYKYARYGAFEIGSESEQYVLKELGKHTGTVDDSMSYLKGMKFSTKDRDNDADISFHWAQYFEGAWWYKDWTLSNLNGSYRDSRINDCKLMRWYDFHGDCQGLSYSRMMIRELD